MNKKLLTVAIGAALGVVPMLSAQADVKIGGHVQAEAYSAKAECNVGVNTAAATGIFAGSGVCAAANARSAKGTGLIDNARGRFWITASEDMGGGLKGLVHYEFSVDTANSGQAFTEGNSASPYDTTGRTFDQRTREKFVGISGGFGAVKLGNQHGVYKRMGGVRWDSFNATVLEARGNGGQSGSADVNRGFAHNGFIAGAIKYESGKAFGDMVALEVLYAPHKNSNGAGDAGSGNDYQVGVSVKPIKDLEIIAVHSNNKKQPNLVTNSDQKANKVGARFTFLKDHTVFGQYEKVDMNNSATASVPTGAGVTDTAALPAIDGKYLLLGYSAKFGNNSVVLQAGQHEREVTGGDVETDYFAVGFVHSFSKTTSVWVGYRQSEAERLAVSNEVKVIALGMRKNF